MRSKSVYDERDEMKKLLLIYILICAGLIYGQTNKPTDTGMLRITDARENGKPGGLSDRYCVVVYQDGRVHLERRMQQNPQQFNTLTVFDSRLNAVQTRSMEQILSASSLASLPLYRPPVFPMGISTFNLFNVVIKKNGENRAVGYLDWQNKEWPGSPNDTPDGIKQGWQVSKAALLPLLLWVRELESSQLPPVDAESTACN